MNVPFERLRVLRDIAGQLKSEELSEALTELIHLRAAAAVVVDGVSVYADAIIQPDDIEIAKLVRQMGPQAFSKQHYRGCGQSAGARCLACELEKAMGVK